MKHIKLFEAFVNESKYSNKGNWKGSSDSNPMSFWSYVHHIVISDPVNGLSNEDPKKVENILFIINKELIRLGKINKMNFKNLEKNDILDNLKYYEKTDKIVGKLPTWMFNKKPKENKNSMHFAKFYDSLKHRYPDLQLTLKKSIK